MGLGPDGEEGKTACARPAASVGRQRLWPGGTPLPGWRVGGAAPAALAADGLLRFQQSLRSETASRISHIRQKQDSGPQDPQGPPPGCLLSVGEPENSPLTCAHPPHNAQAQTGGYPPLRRPSLLASLRLPPRRACDWSAARPGRGAQLPIGQRSESGFRSRRFQIRARVGRSLFAS